MGYFCPFPKVWHFWGFHGMSQVFCESSLLWLLLTQMSPNSTVVVLSLVIVLFPASWNLILRMPGLVSARDSRAPTFGLLELLCLQLFLWYSALQIPSASASLNSSLCVLSFVRLLCSASGFGNCLQEETWATIGLTLFFVFSSLRSQSPVLLIVWHLKTMSHMFDIKSLAV